MATLNNQTVFQEYMINLWLQKPVFLWFYPHHVGESTPVISWGGTFHGLWLIRNLFTEGGNSPKVPNFSGM